MNNKVETNKESNVIVLSGVNGHLGLYILKSLLQNYKVIGLSRNAKVVRKKLSFEESNNYFPLDIDFKKKKVEYVFDKVQKINNKHNFEIKGLINNAIFNYPSAPFAIDEKTLAESTEGIYGYHIRLAITFSNIMKKNSSIINISSIYGKVSPNPNLYENKENINPLLYGSMKAALIQSTKYLSSNFAKKGIRVNSISYGPFPSLETQKLNPKFIEKLASNTHIGRIGRPDEATGIIKFLLSNESSYITGTDIAVDGGWTSW